MAKKMVNKTLLLIAIILAIQLVSAATIFSDTFEDGSINDWTTTGGAGNWHANNTGPIDPPINSWHIISSNVPNPVYAERSINTNGYQNITFSFYYKPDTNDLDCADGDFLRGEWYDGSSWSIILDICGNVPTTYTLSTNNLNSAANNNANFKIRFGCNGGPVTSGAEGCAIDNVSIDGSLIPDTIPPSFSNLNEAPANNSQYVSSILYRFNATITDNIAIDSVRIEFNGTNYSVSNISSEYTFTISDLAAGKYFYYWWANDSLGNHNTSAINYFTISKAQGQIALFLNSQQNNLTIQYPQESNISMSSPYGTIILLKDNTNITSQNGLNKTLGANYYNMTAVSTGDQNHSSAAITYFLNITKAQGQVNLLLNSSASNQTAVYTTQTNASASTPYSSISLFRNGADITSENNLFVTLGVNDYNYTATSPGDENHTSASISRFVHMSKAQGQIALFLNGQQDNITIQYPQQINISASTLYGTITLYRNGQEINSENSLNKTFGVNYYNITAVSTGDQNHSSVAITYFLNITKGIIQITLLLNNVQDNSTITYLQNLNASANSSGGTIKLFRDGFDVTSSNSINVILGANYYQYKANATGNENYTDNTNGITLFVNITKKSPDLGMSISITPSDAETYPALTTTQGSETNNGDFDLTYNLFRNNLAVGNPNVVTLNAGTYSYIYNTTGGQNYTSGSINKTLTINKAPNQIILLLNKNAANITIQYPQQINASASSDSSIVSLFRNNIPISSENNLNTTLSFGFYEFLANSSGNTNYLPNSTGIKLYINITKSPSQINLFINNSRNNISIYEGESININATLISGESNIKVYMNNSLIYYGQSPAYNLTNFSSIGFFNITAIYQQTQNYTSSSETFFINVTEAPDITPPIISIALPKDGSSYGTNISLKLNFSVYDKHLDSCWYNIDNTNNITIQNCSNTTFNTSSQSHSLFLFANDSSNNIGLSNANFSIILGAPSISLLYPSNNYINSNLIQLNFTATDPNLESCELWGNFSSIFEKNQTITGLTSDSILSFYLNLSDGKYLWNVFCNDTFGNGAFNGNKTFTVDTTPPNILISQPSGTKNTRNNIPLNFIINEINLGTCWYNIFQGILQVIENTSINCSISSTFNVTLDATFTLNLYANDSANNLNSTSSSFIIDTSISSEGGGPSGGGGSSSRGGISTVILPKNNILSPNSTRELKLKFILPELLIVKRGTSVDFYIEVINNEQAFLNNCKLQFDSSYKEWFTDQPPIGLSAGEKFKYNLKINVPVSTKEGDFNPKFVLQCDEGKQSSNIKISVFQNSFESQIKDYEKTVDSLRVFYTIEEFEQIDHKITIDYELIDIKDILVTKGTELLNLKAGEKLDRTLEFKIPKDSAGEYKLRMTLNDGVTKNDLSKTILLQNKGIFGLAISENNRRTLSLFGIIVISVISIIFIGRFVYKKIKLNKIKSPIEKKHSKKLIKINLHH